MELTNISFSANNAVQSAKVQNAMADYQKKAEEVKNTEKSANNENVDTYSKGNETVDSETGIYSKESIKKTVEELEEQRKQALTNMVSEMLGHQANAKGLEFIKNPNMEVTAEDITEAKESISEGGYWSVDAVATRIMDMASLLANGDASKVDMLKEAVIKGFGGAVKALGRESLDDMPEITRNTYDEVMKRFDDFAKELSGTSETESTVE